jgi:CheY-like chemotaxis protein
MNILFLENSGSIAYPIEDALQTKGHNVFIAISISAAKSYWEKEREKLDCIIADINMEPFGLKEEEVKQTAGGLLSGWIWLKNYVFPEREDMKKRTIILTAYSREFREKVPYEEREGIILIAKESPSDVDPNDVIKQVDKILKKGT